MEFSRAAEVWLEHHRVQWKDRTLYGQQQQIKQLGKFLGGAVLRNIHIGQICEYQRRRTENEGSLWDKKCGPSCLNHEISTLQMILKYAGLWEAIRPHYKPLRTPTWTKPKVMEPHERARFFAVAASRPQFQLAFWVAVITSQTGASGTELRNLRFTDVCLDAARPHFIINGETAKNTTYFRLAIGALGVTT
jgi:hypothetical protein